MHFTLHVIFADDCILYRTIKTYEDATKLQQDLDLPHVHEWAVKWQLGFNVNKCYYYVLHKNFITNYLQL